MKFRFAALGAAALWVGGGSALHAQAQGGGSDARHIINLDEADISAFVDDVAMLTGYTFIEHPDLRGTVSVSSQTALSSKDVFDLFVSTLQVNGYVVVPEGRGMFRIVPTEGAATEGGAGAGGSGGFASDVLRLDYFDAAEAARMVRPLISTNGQITTSPLSNAIIVSDYASNVSRIRYLVGQLDKDRLVTRTIGLKTIPVSEVQDILNNLNIAGGSEQARRSFSAVGSAANNAIVLRGDATTVARAVEIVEALDTVPPFRNDTRVISLSHSDAVDVEPILQQVAEVLAAEAGPDGGPGVGASISVHEPTNSLVISADSETLAAMEGVVADLDVRRKQVHLEALIVDISDSAAKELGVQFALAGTEGNLPFASTNFTRSAPNILALTGAVADGSFLDGDDPTPSPFEQAALATLLGSDGLLLGATGQSGNTLFGIVVDALETDTETNILSSPSVVTQDNEPALLSVGQEIPVTSGEVLGDANANPFRTVDRQNVGIILTVTPRVAQDETILLEVNQEISSVAGTVGELTPDFIVNETTIQTRVLVDNGDLVALGGLVQETETVDESQVPLLGDIPGLGRLFQSRGSSLDRSNLMLFIRATILEDREDARNLSRRSYNYIRAQQILAGNRDVPGIDQFVSEVLQVTPPIVVPGEEEGEPSS